MKQADDVLGFFDGLSIATWTSSALAALLESGIFDELVAPRTVADLAARHPSLSAGQIRRCLDVAVSSGLARKDGDGYRAAEGMVSLLAEGPMRNIVQADLRSALMQGLDFLDAATGDRPRVGWRHEDPRILRGQGEGSVMIARLLQRRFVPELDGLAERFASDGARFLDVGVGVGALSVEMCRAFPKLSALGLDVHEPALALARKTVAEANMSERIEIRALPIEDLRDDGAFDLAWFPSFFIPNARAATASIRRALRPGGWVVCAVVGSGGTEKENAAWAFVGELWGGEQLSPAEVADIFRADGFATVRELPSPAPGVAFIAGRR